MLISRSADFSTANYMPPPESGPPCCSAVTKAKFWDSGAAATTTHQNDGWLDDKSLSNKITEISHVFKQDGLSESKKSRFFLIASIGDPSPISYNRPIQMSLDMLQATISTCRLPPSFLEIMKSGDFHISSDIHYNDNDEETPIEMTIMARVPRNSQNINCGLRIRLHDLTCVAFLTGADEKMMDALRVRCIREWSKPGAHPLSLLPSILEERNDFCYAWYSHLKSEVYVLETTTGMTKTSWKRDIPVELAEWLAHHENLLSMLHSVHVELCHCETVLTYLMKFGTFFLDTMDQLESLRKECGYAPLKRARRAALEQNTRYLLALWGLRQDRVKELMNRLRGQINVTFSLITQRDSKINLAVAEGSHRVAFLAARDSATMKTITVLTLVFLPPSLITSIWSANLFHLDEKDNWRVYVGCCIGVTLLVFASWIAYWKSSPHYRRKEPELLLANIQTGWDRRQFDDMP